MNIYMLGSKLLNDKMAYLIKITIGFFVILLILLAFKPIQAVVDSAIKGESDRFHTSLVFDKNGVPYYNYSNTGHPSIGLQGSPHAVSTHATNLYKQYMTTSNESLKASFINNVNWLVNTNMLKHNGSFSSYEFSFPWSNGNHTIVPPWRDAMVNSEALSPLAKAYQLTGNRTYLDIAKKLLNSFYFNVKEGGVTYKRPSSGWFYEEYASRNSAVEPRVLNGMIHAIFGIDEYYKDTNDSSAKFLFDQGILALKNDLSKYDHNGTSFYDRLGLNANPFYRSLHVMQLEKLYNLTNESIFKIYHDKWNNYNLSDKSH